MTFTLIGLAGRAGVGKDTAADYLGHRHHFATYAFAAPIRAGLRAMLRLRDYHFTDRELKEQPLEQIGVSPRKLMQTLGTEWGRTCIHRDLWLMVAAGEISNLKVQGVKRLIITDLRFDNEADWVRQQGGKVLHILRPDAPVIEGHASEAGVHMRPNDDLWIVNDGSIADLHYGLDRLMDDIA